MMKATIICDSENTERLIHYLIKNGSCNSRPNDLIEQGIKFYDTNLDITFSIEKPVPPIRIDVTIDKPKPRKKKKAEGNPTLYAARCVETGKLVSDLTNPRRKYWDKEGNARNAIDYYNKYYANKDHNPRVTNKGKHGIVKLVKFELVEVPVDEN